MRITDGMYEDFVSNLKWYVSEPGSGKYYPVDHSPEANESYAVFSKQTVKGAIAHYYESVILKHDSKMEICKRRGFVKNLEQFCAGRKIEELSKLGAADMELFHAQRCNGRRPVSVNNEMVIINHFFDKCIEWKYILENPAKGIKRLKVIPRKRILWEDAKMNLALRSCPKLVRAGKWFRNGLRLLRYTCMRPIELGNMQIGDVTFIDDSDPNYKSGYRGYIQLYCNKRRDGARILPFDYRVARILKVQIRRRTETTEFVFLNRCGDRIKTNAMYDNIKRLEKITGFAFPKNYSIRHTGATKLCRKNVNLRKIQRYLGHKSINSTLHYTLVDTNDLQDCLKQL